LALTVAPGLNGESLMTISKCRFAAQDIAATLEPLARQGIEVAQEFDLPKLKNVCCWALEVLQTGGAEDLVAALVAIGYRSRDREVRRLETVVKFYRQREARRARSGRKPRVPYPLLAHRVAELVRGDMQLEEAKRQVASDLKVGRSTVEAALRQQRLMADPLGAGFEASLARAIRDWERQQIMSENKVVRQ
jgi:hypothetical protein